MAFPDIYRIPMYGKRLLLIDYVASTASGHSPDKALERKDKKSLPIPVRFVLYDFDIKSKCQKKTFSNLLHSFASGDTVQQRSIFTFQLPTFSNIRLLMLYFHFSQPYFMYTVKVHAFLFIYTKFFSKLTQVKTYSGSCYNTSLFDLVRLICFFFCLYVSLICRFF